MDEDSAAPDGGWSSLQFGRPWAARTLLWVGGLVAIVVGGIMTAVHSDAAGRAQALSNGGFGRDSGALMSSATHWMVFGILVVTVGVVSLVAWLLTRPDPRGESPGEPGFPEPDATLT